MRFRFPRGLHLQTYHQDKIPSVTAGAGTGNLFSVLGNVDDFLKPNSVLSRDGFETWMKANERSLGERVRGWIPGELAAADRDTLLKEMVADTMKAIDLALHERTTQVPQERVTIDPLDAPETQPETDEEKPPVATANRALLDTLLYKGVLPRYAFPTPVTDRIRYVTARTHLLVSNTGPASKGYSYCTACGRIEATSAKTGSLSRLHPKPYPDEKKPNCPGYTSEGIVLGTDFITDVALFSLRLDDPIRLSAGETITQTALRTLAEALARAACDLLEIEPGEVQAEYRPALSQEGKQGYETEIFLYDTLPGGAGFSQAAAQAGRTIFDLALERMTACPEGTKCDLSCYRCLRTFRNRIDHSALDRHTGRALLNFLLNGDSSGFNDRRLRAASRLLVDDLERQLPAGWAVSNASLKTADLPAGCVAPIEVVDALERRHLVVVRSPLEDLNSKKSLETKGTPWASIQEVSELEVRKNLPAATNRVRRDIAALG